MSTEMRLIVVDDSTVIIRPEPSKEGSDVAGLGGEDVARPIKKITHDELVRQIREIISELGLITFIRRKWSFRGFTPDLVILIGPTEGDWFAIDAVTTKGSFNRDLGGLVHMREISPRATGECMLVLSDVVARESSIRPLVLRRQVNAFLLRHGVYVVTLDVLRPWLRFIVSRRAEATARQFEEPSINPEIPVTGKEP